MNTIPNIIVQLIHIEGPLKGEIQEFPLSEILIGRHPDCHCQFPKDLVTLSRKHAQIIREGNRFKLIDKSTNGTFVNGQRFPEAYLKDGDVITFSEGGPKVSFLTRISDQPAPHPPQPTPVGRPVQQAPHSQAAPMAPSPSPPIQPPHPAHMPPPGQQAPVAAAPSAAPMVQSVKVPFAIQYGPTLKSFQTLPITLGRGASSDFIINHRALNDQQVQLFFAQDQYWIKDLTGTNAVLINGVPIAGQAALAPDMQISLSPRGPKFRFLGGGRLVEVEDPLPQAPPQTPPSASKAPEEPGKSAPGKKKKPGALFKNFFSS